MGLPAIAFAAVGAVRIVRAEGASSSQGAAVLFTVGIALIAAVYRSWLNGRFPGDAPAAQKRGLEVPEFAPNL
jgi:hypothetical protein